MKSNYIVISSDPEKVVLRDLGPWNTYMTITNDAENVVQHLYEMGAVREGTRIYYYDSDNELTELRHEDGAFIGFGRGFFGEDRHD